MGGYSREDRELIWEFSLGKCAMCGAELDEDDWEADDILATGHHGPLGGRALCPECHKKTITYGKGQKGIIDYYG